MVDRSRLVPVVTVRIETDVPTDSIGERIKTAMFEELQVTPKVEFVNVGDLPRFEGKAKRVVVKEREQTG